MRVWDNTPSIHRILVFTAIDKTKRLVKAHKNRFDAGSWRLRERRKSWDTLADNAINIFEAIKSRCASEKLFENVYIFDSREMRVTKNMLPHVTFFFGQHPLGYTTFKDFSAPVVEGGCAVTISQNILGHVGCIYYPFGSELAEMKTPYLITAIYKDPNKVTIRKIHKIASRLFAYAQLSSVYGAPNLADRVKVQLMHISHWRKSEEAKEFFKKVIIGVSNAAIKAAAKGGT